MESTVTRVLYCQHAKILNGIKQNLVGELYMHLRMWVFVVG